MLFKVNGLPQDSPENKRCELYSSGKLQKQFVVGFPPLVGTGLQISHKNGRVSSLAF